MGRAAGLARCLPDRATVNLRGLGPSRSLVLLNSRRMPLSPGSIPDQAQLVVDVNLLPFAALQSMEVLREGAAATYGSDAIAGVVNFITRSDYEGVEVEARHKAVDGSGGDDRLALIAGRAFGGGAGHVVTSIGYASRSPLAMVDRDWAVRSYAENVRGGWTGTGRPGDFVPLQAFAATAGDATAMHRVGIVDPNCERIGGALQNLERYPCRGGPTIVDCTSGRTGVFIYLPPGYDASADRNVSAVFGEAELPLTLDLNVQLSLRYEHYRQQGLSSLDPRLAVRWQVRPNLALRASAGTRTLSWKIDGWQFGPAYDAIGRLNYDTPLARTVLDWKGHLWFNAAVGHLNVRWTLRHTPASRSTRPSSTSPTANRRGYTANSTTIP